MTITRKQARQFLLYHQQLRPPRKLKGKDGILEFIRKVGCIQFDPLNMVGFNPQLVLQSRVKGFQSVHLEELLYQDRRLVENYDKLMSLFPLEDWPCFQRTRQRMRSRWKSGPEAIRKLVPEVRRAIEERGPLSSLDLKSEEKVDWSWAPANLTRAAMETLYFAGELVVYDRIHTRRRYALSEQLIPEDLLNAPDPFDSSEAFTDWRVLRRIGGIGLVWDKSGDAWLGIPDLKTAARGASLSRLEQRGLIRRVRVEGISYAFYLRSCDMEVLEQALAPSKSAPGAFILAPLDNLIWDRKLIKVLFDFDYVWEVYKPAKDRRYGYYVLPLMFGDRFIGRLEPVYNRQTKTLIIKNWWWEEGLRITVAMKKAVERCLKEFMRYLGAESIDVEDAGGRSYPDWL